MSGLLKATGAAVTRFIDHAVGPGGFIRSLSLCLTQRQRNSVINATRAVCIVAILSVGAASARAEQIRTAFKQLIRKDNATTKIVLAAAPIVVLTASASSVARVAPFTLVLDVVRSSTLGAGTWSRALVRWSISDPSNILEKPADITDPVTGATRSYLTDCFGRCLGIHVKHGASGTATITATVTNSSGLSSTGTFTIGSTGTPDVSFTTRTTGGTNWYLVSSAGSDASPTGAGTFADPKSYRTYRAAIIAIGTTSSCTITLKDDETHLVAATVSCNAKNLWVRRSGDGTAKPILQGSGDYLLFGGSTNGPENALFTDIDAAPSTAITAVTQKAYSVVADSMGWVNCRIEGSLSGNGFEEGWGLTHNRDGFTLINPYCGAVYRHVFYSEQYSSWVWGFDFRAGKTEQIMRLGPLTNRITLIYGVSDYTGGTASKTALRTAFSDHLDAFHCKFVGTVQIGHSARLGDWCEYPRFDGCLFNFTGGDSSLLILMDSVVDASVVNCVLVNDRSGKSCMTCRPDYNTRATDNAWFQCNTLLQQHVSGGSVAGFGDETFAYTGTGNRWENNLHVAVGTTWAQRFFSRGDKFEFDAIANNVFAKTDGIANSFAVATMDIAGVNTAHYKGNSPTFASLTSSPNNVSGTAYETIDPTSITQLTGWRSDNATVVAGATTPVGVHHDIHLATRGATSYIGAADVSGGGDPPTPPDLDPPTLGTVTAGTLQLSIAVTAGGGTDATGYKVYQRAGASMSGNVSNADLSFDTADLTSPIVVTGLSAGTTYYFLARETDGLDNTSSNSNEVSGTPNGTAPDLDPPTLGSVTSGVNSASIAITAGGGTDAVRFKVYQRAGASMGGSTQNADTSFTTSGLSSPISVSSLTNGMRYYFVAVEVDSAGNESAVGNEVYADPYFKYHKAFAGSSWYFIREGA